MPLVPCTQTEPPTSAAACSVTFPFVPNEPAFPLEALEYAPSRLSKESVAKVFEIANRPQLQTA